MDPALTKTLAGLSHQVSIFALKFPLPSQRFCSPVAVSSEKPHLAHRLIRRFTAADVSAPEFLRDKEVNFPRKCYDRRSRASLFLRAHANHSYSEELDYGETSRSFHTQMQFFPAHLCSELAKSFAFCCVLVTAQKNAEASASQAPRSGI
jgi:hypothetical protein